VISRKQTLRATGSLVSALRKIMRSVDDPAGNPGLREFAFDKR
jgi:hypothetical protein